MNITFVPSYPTTGYQWRSESHKPGIGVIIGRSCFSTHIGGNSITANTSTRSFINNGTQHNQHFVSARRAYHFFHLRCKSRNDIAITILNTGNEQWSHPDSFIGKSRVCADHFTDRNFTRSQTKWNHRINCFITYTETMNQAYQIIRIQLTHQICRNPVIGVCQSPFQSYHFSITLIICITWCPGSSILINQSLLYVACLIARRKSVLHCQCI